MSGIVGAVGLHASQAADEMREALRHRGVARSQVSGALANGLTYSMMELNTAKSSSISYTASTSTGVMDRLYTGYAQAQVIDVRFIALERDDIGSRPLFYGIDDAATLCAFASERKALWAVGIEHALRVDPRVTVILDQHLRITTHAKNRLESCQEPYNDERCVANELLKLLKIVVDELAQGQMAVAFSGGLDSSLLCSLSTNIAGKCHYTAGLIDSFDIRSARHAAHLMQIELEAIELTLSDVQTLVPYVMEATESRNPLHIAISLPLYVLSREAKAAGFAKVLSGQGADELFAGYRKYVTLSSVAPEALRAALRADVLNIAKDNLERDNLAAAANSIDVVLPYLDPRLVAFGLRINCALKVRGGVSKYILRRAAEQVMPRELAHKQKKAMQYGTGVTGALRTLARNQLPHEVGKGQGAVGRYLQLLAEKHDIKVAE